jgi:hypothetical protein
MLRLGLASNDYTYICICIFKWCLGTSELIMNTVFYTSFAVFCIFCTVNLYCAWHLKIADVATVPRRISKSSTLQLSLAISEAECTRCSCSYDHFQASTYTNELSLLECRHKRSCHAISWCVLGGKMFRRLYPQFFYFIKNNEIVQRAVLKVLISKNIYCI